MKHEAHCPRCNRYLGKVPKPRKTDMGTLYCRNCKWVDVLIEGEEDTRTAA